MKRLIIASIAMLVLGGCGSRPAPKDAMRLDTETLDPDNTVVNARDRRDVTKTPIDQNENRQDIDITAGIRTRVIDQSMSVDAHNVKIITQKGRVTLRGPVKTADEKKKIESIAMDVAGLGNVDSQLEVEAGP